LFGIEPEVAILFRKSAAGKNTNVDIHTS
jgi:hypothetical protein